MTQKKKTHLKILTPPDDLSEIMKKVHKFRRAKVRRILVLIVLIILAVCGTYLLLKNQSYGHARTAAEYSSDISDTSNYAQFANGIVRYNRDGVAFLNNKNEEQWIQPTQLQNPVITVKEESFAVADNGGNNILVFSEEGLRGEIETTLPIEKISISDQGIVSVLMRNGSTPSIITYDAAGNILAEIQITQGTMGYPTAMEMSDDGNTLAVSYLYLDGVNIKSRVIYYNFGEAGQENADNIVSSEEYDNTVMADIFFMGGGRSVAVGDNSFVIYRGTDTPQPEKTIVIDQEIQSVFHSDQYIGFILLNQEKSGYEVRLYNRIGEQLISREIPGNYSNVKMDGDEIIMFDGSRCCIVTATGIIKYDGNLDVDALEIFRAFGVNRYYVMSVDELRVIYLTK
ncbi:MAG TPA: hypothetical protein H9765_03990 [Candidatus Mediterraneibacter intestinigallinarum]|nr:hypothetical protein [Candidatus Mediterraneibacter intestinigallinarum]